MSAWDTDLGRWALAWRDYRRYQDWLDAAAEWRRTTPQRSREEVIAHVMQAQDGVLRALAESERQDRTIAADEAFAREIALAREVVYPIPADVPIPSCGDCLEPLDGRESCGCLDREVCEDAEVDALAQPVPTVTLPFGGDGGSRE